jgi:N-acetylglucosaminyldiphosphoundecaprenol N-acetyl-beta-D-mannosaminyltransferase
VSAAATPARGLPSQADGGSGRLQVLGVGFLDWTMDRAVERLIAELRRPGQAGQDGPARSVYFVNAATLNLASQDAAYRDVLNAGDYVFGDGTGARIGARLLHGVRLQDNVNGTDLTPALFARAAGQGLRYFLLGATPDAIERAAAEARRRFPGWELAGHHHGYLTSEVLNEAAIRQINAARADLLLVGMGNPLQETWIHRHRDRLQVRLAMAVGGLFTYWSGDLGRAPGWVRRLGYEWAHILVSQPHKARRYILGNPLFLARVLREKIRG